MDGGMSEEFLFENSIKITKVFENTKEFHIFTEKKNRNENAPFDICQ